ncbi:6-phosphogluconolactonase [Candidatus Liberibacter sp.]|uniref:6-phosphogluconolactonase n=1 Tax=Candidatus Liberibacter sp. TaxID=34022 RepID=UPI002174EDAF|nr:6-phosphogluconolactonase [Candidatus Liberibacter sp.]
MKILKKISDNALTLHTFLNRQELAQKLAQRVATQLSVSIQNRGSANLALSGGSTPKIFLQELSKKDIDWGKIMVTLVDERFVSLDDSRSNQALISQYLLQKKARKSSFIALYYPSDTVQESALLANDKIRKFIDFPFDVVVLGMGIDGHTASFFPKGNNLAMALDTNTPPSIIATEDPSINEKRITMTFSALRDARFLSLHIESVRKKDILEVALSGFSEEEMPIRAILRRATSPVDIYWAP